MKSDAPKKETWFAFVIGGIFLIALVLGVGYQIFRGPITPDRKLIAKTPEKTFLVARPQMRGHSLVKAVGSAREACLKAGWKYDAPRVVMDMTDALADRNSTIRELESLRTGMVLDRVGDYTVLGSETDGKITLVSGKTSSSSLRACLEAGWGASECGHIQLTVTGLMVEKMSLLTKQQSDQRG